jgi:hypothetical protein
MRCCSRLAPPAAPKGNKVLYFAGYKKLSDRYKVAEIEAAADCIIWCCDEAPGFAASRPGDFSFTGNMLQALVAYAEGKIGHRRHRPARG